MIINIPALSDQIKSFMDQRHYDPNEIDDLYLSPNSNGESTFYVDGTNGNDSYDGLYPDNTMGGSHGPFRTVFKATAQYDGHRWGERVLIRTGRYQVDNWNLIMNLAGTQDANHYFTLAPYGDGEVVFDLSKTYHLNSFSLLTGHIYQATYVDAANNFDPGFIVMDYEQRTCRRSNGVSGSDNSGVNNKTTSMTDTRRSFLAYVTQYSSGSLNPVGGIIYNVEDKSWAVITSVSTTTNANDTVNFSGGLQGGTNNKFNDNDPYIVMLLNSDGQYFYIDHFKRVKDNSGVNNKTNYVVDTTQNFAGYTGGIISIARNGSSNFGMITSIATTTNTNDTIRFDKGLLVQYGDSIAFNNGDGNNGDGGAVNGDSTNNIIIYKRISTYDINGVTNGFYWQDAPHVMIDTTKNFAGYEGAYIQNLSDGSFAKITQITTTTNPNDTLICGSGIGGGLKGGATNTFQSGDNYQVFRVASSNNKLFIRSDTGTPASRNIIVNNNDGNNDNIGVTVDNTYMRFYGITFLSSPSIGLWFRDVSHGIVEKCRFLFCGKHGVQGGLQDGNDTGNYKILRCFTYQAIMRNWPRGDNYGANGGWPQTMQILGHGTIYDGCITVDGGGEGLGYAETIQNCIVANNYSMGIYFEPTKSPVIGDINSNVILQTHFDVLDMLDNFYLSGSYNGYGRNYSKMHTQGINLAAENSGPLIAPANIKIYNNIIIGCWKGIGQLFEWGPNGLTNDQICNNTIILPSFSKTEADGLFEAVSGIYIRLSSADSSSIVKNNIIIGSVIPSRHYLLQVYSGTYANLTIDNNLYSYPSLSAPFNIDGNADKTFAQWKTLTGWDANSTLTDTPGLTGVNWSDLSTIRKEHIKLLSTSVGVDTGTDLSAYFTTDFNGSNRPNGAVWDKGAIEYSTDTKNYTKEAITSLPAGTTDLSTAFLPVEYDYLVSIDSRFASILATNKYGVFYFKDKSLIGHPPISMKWVGKTTIAGSVSMVYLQIYNQNTTAWETMASNNSVAANTQFTMSGVINNNLVNYYDGNNIAICRVYQLASA